MQAQNVLQFIWPVEQAQARPFALLFYVGSVKSELTFTSDVER